MFLDVDGTLCPIVSRPADVSIGDDLRRLLAAVAQRLDGALALISGRSLGWLAAETAGLRLALAGTHGLELRSLDGQVTTAPVLPGLAAAKADARHFAAHRPGILVELKPLGLAIHYRLAAECADAVVAFARDLARRHRLPLQIGNMVVELKGGDGDKGVAISRLLATPPFRGRTPIFVGDDLTDEAAFVAATAAGGFGILVGAPRPTAAAFGLADPAAVHRWLGASA